MLQKLKKNSGSQRENCSVLQDFGSLKKKDKGGGYAGYSSNLSWL